MYENDTTSNGDVFGGEGHCVACNGTELTYGNVTMPDNCVWIPYICTKCGHAGSEICGIEYQESE